MAGHRGAPGAWRTYRAAMLLQTCRWRVAPLLLGVARLSAPLHGTCPLRLSASQLAGGRRWHPPRHDQGWTVFHLPSTPGTCEPFNPQPTVQIKQGDPVETGR